MTQLCLIILLIFKKVKEKILSNIELWGTIDIVLDIQCDILYHRTLETVIQYIHPHKDILSSYKKMRKIY